MINPKEPNVSEHSLRSPQSRYVLPSFVERTSYGIKEMNPYNKLFEERIIFLGVQIDDASANDVMAQLITLESIDPGGRQMKLLGPERAIGCVLNPAADLIAPGLIRHVHGRKFPIGEPSGERTGRIERLHQAMQEAGLEAPIRTDIRDEIWLKLWGNLCLSPISALTCATLDLVATDPGTRAVCLAMMAEGRQLAERIGVNLRVDADRRLDGAAAIGPHKISMLVDLETGRPMEIDPIVTVVQEIGQRLAIPTPTIDVVAALIKLRQRTAG